MGQFYMGHVWVELRGTSCPLQPHMWPGSAGAGHRAVGRGVTAPLLNMQSVLLTTCGQLEVQRCRGTAPHPPVGAWIKSGEAVTAHHNKPPLGLLLLLYSPRPEAGAGVLVAGVAPALPGHTAVLVTP